MKTNLLSVLILLLGFFGLSNAQLPGDFPGITTIQSGETGEGYVFLAVASEVEGIGYYLIILDNDGTAVKYKKLDNDYAYDFKVQPNGQLSYAQFLSHHSYTGGGNVIHMIMDQDMNIVDSIQLKNGYIAEAHDFQILPNGHYLAFGYYLTKVDMSQIVDGGHPAACVSGGIVQEFDADKNVVWQWRSWDHYEFEDYIWGRRSTRETVSTWHLNTIGLDYDGNMLIASPSWVKKINRQTGELMWDLGGDLNDFNFVGVDSADATDHFTGHAIYLLENGNYLTFDNGGRRRKDPSSEVHEYSIDMENLVATHVQTFAHDSTIGSWHRGNGYRLPNGNTIVGWGGASGDPIPAATEFDAEGNIVWEAFFDNPEVESYRAFRFPLDADTASAEVEEDELTAGEWIFNLGDTITGITLDIANITNTGYNTVTVSRYNYAPMDPAFPGRAPLVMAKRVVVKSTAITSIDGDIVFDVAEFNIRNPEEITIYHREFEGSGLFVPLTTDYNDVTGEISAPFDKTGEFIITWPDVEVIVGVAQLIWPELDEDVNQDHPVHVEWAPNGFFTDFNLQIATDETFETIVVDSNLEYSTVFEFTNAEDATTYYWRVKTMNETDEGDWSDTSYFNTAPPAVMVTSPNGEEEWQAGLDYWIKWNDNLPEDVVVELHKADALESVIDTIESKGAWAWTIPDDLDPGTDYSIVIKSAEDEAVIDASDLHFSIIDTVSAIQTQSILERNLVIYPNPTDKQVTIQYQLADYVDVTVRIFDITGRLLNTQNEGKQIPGDHQIMYNLGSLEGNFFIIQLQAGDERIHRKISLIR